MDVDALTRIEKVGTKYYKRDDDFVINNVCGGKVRIINEIVQQGIKNGYRNFVTCGSRDSRQCESLAKICEYYDVKSHIFMPNGQITDIITSIEHSNGATIHRTKVGYNTVLVSESKKFSNDNKMCYIPFGMNFKETIEINKKQVKNVPKDVKRIIIPCGGGMNMISVIKGLEYFGYTNISVVGVIVGANPKMTFNKWLPNTLFDYSPIKWSFVTSEYKYGKPSKKTIVDGIELDEMYEAKCIPFIEDGDLLWIVGKKL